MADYTNKKYKELSREEYFEFSDYLTREMWDKGKESIECPFCGGVIRTKYFGNSSITECSTHGCVHIESRGI